MLPVNNVVGYIEFEHLYKFLMEHCEMFQKLKLNVNVKNCYSLYKIVGLESHREFALYIGTDNEGTKYFAVLEMLFDHDTKLYDRIYDVNYILIVNDIKEENDYYICKNGIKLFNENAKLYLKHKFKLYFKYSSDKIEKMIITENTRN